MARKPKGGRYGVTGPGLDNVSYPEQGAAFSASITFAERAAKAGIDATYYVRDLDGTPLSYSESTGKTKSTISRHVTTW